MTGSAEAVRASEEVRACISAAPSVDDVFIDEAVT